MLNESDGHRSVRRLMATMPEEFGDIDTTSVNAANGRIDTAVVIDATSNRELGQIGGHPKGHPEFMLRTRREVLRDYLSKGLDIQYGKHFVSFRETEERVIATFKDDSEYHGSILVGSDGASSRVRAQLLSGQQSEPARFIPIVGMINLSSKEEVNEFQDIATAVFIACTETVRLMVGLLSTAPDRSSAKAYYAVCYKPAVIESELEWFHAASQEALYQKAISQIGDISSNLTKFVHLSSAHEIVSPPLSFKEFLPPMMLPAGRVTLIGDSLHSMMPLRGAGANTAILDACDLAEVLTQAPSRTERDEVVDILRQYANIACPRGRDVVAATHSAGEDMHMTFGIEKQLAQKLLSMNKKV